MKTIDLSKQQSIDTDPKVIQQILFKRNLNRDEDANDNTSMFFIVEEAKETVLDFSQRTLILSFAFI